MDKNLGLGISIIFENFRPDIDDSYIIIPHEILPDIIRCFHTERPSHSTIEKGEAGALFLHLTNRPYVRSCSELLRLTIESQMKGLRIFSALWWAMGGLLIERADDRKRTHSMLCCLNFSQEASRY